MFKKISKRDFSILLGNALEHFDTSLYGFLAPILAPIFFPQYEPIVQLILTYSLVATSLVTKPVGTFIFGSIARDRGPVMGLSYSLIGVAIATTAIGFVPSYAQAGWLAPFSLIVLRFVRGIFAAGESTIASVYIIEDKQHHDALKASYWYQTSTMVGIILASGAATLSILSDYDDISWRICFWLGGITGFIGYFLRRFSTQNSERKKEDLFSGYKVSNIKSLWFNRENILRIAICTACSYITYTIPFVFLNSFVPMVTAISLETMMTLNSALLIIDMLLIPICGKFLLKFDIQNVMLTASLVLAVTVLPLFINLPNASLGYVTFFRIWIVFWGVVFMCPATLWFKNLFNSPEQYLHIGIGKALGSATVGRMSTAICLWLWHTTGSLVTPGLFMVSIMIATVMAIQIAPAPKTAHRSL
jgi:MFS family permease